MVPCCPPGPRAGQEGTTRSVARSARIATTAIQHGLPLWTVDGDFKRIAAVAPLHLDLFGAD
ncbi:MAG TPA: hypothetical protein VN666_14490 [Nitrospira sp.]|nr:hypothetical protein [Nitrospira sp.]